MSYKDILTNIKSQEQNYHTNQKLYRYTGLIQAIEFFSQRFDVHEIIDYAYDFINELLMPEKAAVWQLKDGNYRLVCNKGYKGEINFPYNATFDQIVYFHAGLLTKEVVENYFPKEFIEAYTFDFVIPLVMDKSFFGFIIVQKSNETSFSAEDEIIASALMQLFSISLTNFMRFRDLETIQAKLDEKVFNLFAINQSTKALLSELSLDGLYDLSISVFSELTQSSFTTFFIKDPISENYELKSYRDVSGRKKLPSLTLYEKKEEQYPYNVVVDKANEEEYNAFLQLFHNAREVLQELEIEYIVLLKKGDELVGFVTLGKKVNDASYEKGIFELIESLASSTLIAINNAIYIQEIQEKKELINRKLNELMNLNMLMKNMNSAKTLQQVVDLVMTTLNVTFHIDMGFFAQYKEEQFELVDSIGMSKEHPSITMIEPLEPLLDGSNIILYESDHIQDIFPEELIKQFQLDCSGGLLFPVYMEELDIELLGVLVILSTRKKQLITEENLISLEAIANHIAPVIYQIGKMERIKRNYQLDYTKLFIQELENQLREAQDFSLDLYVLHIYHKKTLRFESEDFDAWIEDFHHTYKIDHRNLLMITNQQKNIEAITNDLESQYEYKIYRYQEDFQSIDDFLQISTIK